MAATLTDETALEPAYNVAYGMLLITGGGPGDARQQQGLAPRVLGRAEHGQGHLNLLYQDQRPTLVTFGKYFPEA